MHLYHLVEGLYSPFGAVHAHQDLHVCESSSTCRAVDGLMKDLPLKKLRNFGGKLGAELGEMKCTTAGEVAALPHKALVAKFGEERATFIARAVRGYSDEPVQACNLSSTAGTIV